MKDQPTSREIGYLRRSKALNITALTVIVVLLLGIAVFLSRNVKQTQENSVATQAASNTPTAAWSSGIYIVAHTNWEVSSMSKADPLTHKVLWQYALAGRHASPPTVSSNTVYFSTSDDQMSQNAVYALDADKGSMRWKTILVGRTDQSGYPSQPLYSNGLLYLITQSRGTVTALDASSGKVRWTYESRTDGTASNGQLAVSKGMIYGIIANTLFTLHADTGTVVRNAVQIDPDKAFEKIDVVDGVLYATATGKSSEGSIYAFNAEQGTPLWSYHCTTWISDSVFSGGKVSFITINQFPPDADGQGRLTLYTLSTKGEPIWHKEILNNGVGNLIVANGLLYLGYDVYDLHAQKNASYLRALSTESGADAWIKQIGAQPKLVQNGRVYAGLIPCQIGAFDAQSGKELWHQQYCVPSDSRDRSTPDFVVVP